MLPPRMQIDIILATIAAMAASLNESFPELYLQAVEDAATEALKHWKYTPLEGKKARRYIKRLKKELWAIERSLRFKNVSMAGIVNMWLCLLEYLNEATNMKRDKHLTELRDLLLDYIDNLKLDDERAIDQGIQLCETVTKRLSL